jgi:hypothetical protein
MPKTSEREEALTAELRAKIFRLEKMPPDSAG